MWPVTTFVTLPPLPCLSLHSRSRSPRRSSKKLRSRREKDRKRKKEKERRREKDSKRRKERSSKDKARAKESGKVGGCHVL